MAATLGTYSIDLIAKIAQFESDLGRAARIAEQQGASIKKSIEGAVEGVGDKLKEMAAFLGAGLSLEGLKGLVDKLSETASEALKTAEEMQNLSEVLGVSATTIQTVSLAAHLVGGNLDTATTAITRLSKSAAEANAGNAKLLNDFKALGIGADQLAKLLEHPDDLIRVVTQHLSEFANNGDKVAITTQLMGRGAATAIPMIQELGKHYGELEDQAKKFAGVTDDTIRAMADQQKEFNRTGVEVKGLALKFTAELLPAIKAAQEQMKAGIENPATRDALKTLAGMIDYVALHFKEFVGDVATGSLAGAITKAFLEGTAAGLNFSNEVKVWWYEIERDAAIAWANVLSYVANFATGAVHYLGDVLEAAAKIANLTGNSAVGAQLGALADQLKNAKGPMDSLGDSVAAANLKFWTQASALHSAVTEMQTMIVKAPELDKKLQLPDSSKTTQKVANDLLEMQKILDGLAKNLGGPYDKAWAEYQSAIDQADKAAAKFTADGVSLSKVQNFLAEATALATERFREQTDATLVMDRVLDKINTQYAQRNSLIGLTGTALAIETEYQKMLNEALAAMSSVMGPLTEADQKRLENLHNMAEAQVLLIEKTNLGTQAAKEWQQIWINAGNQITDTFAKVLVEGGSLFKGLADLAKQTVEQIIAYFAKLAVINPILNSVFGGQSGWTQLAQFGGAGSGGGIGGIGAGTILGIGAGLFAGVGEFKAAGGGAGGLAGGATYGIGAYALSGAVTAGVSAAAAGGISAGLAAGFAAIPVVGWIALAAMGLNAVTGGGLFGTKATPYGSETNLSVGAGGANISAAIDEKGKKALFGGSYYKTVSAPVDQATLDSVAAFFAGLQKAADAQAQAYGESTGVIVSGTFHETFDKAGKMLTQVSTVAGQQFKESIQDFQSRIIADTLLANMGDASAEAQKIAEQWQQSASDLMAGAQFLAQAQLDIAHGSALVQGETLTDLTTFVQGMGAQGESLIQTYARLSVETTNVQAILHNLGLDTGKAGEELVKFDDAMVQAAGGLDNLNTLWNDYYTKFYSASEQAAIKLKNDQANQAALFTAIGQDPSESMAQFRQNFQALIGTLTPQDIVKWLQAAEALSAVNADLGITATDNIKQYQDLQAAAENAGQALQKLETDTQSLATSLFGSGLDQLKAKLAGLLAGGAQNTQLILQAQAQIDAQTKAEEAAKRLSDASQLLTNFAQIGAITGQSIGQLAAQFSVPLDQLAQFLGTDSQGLQKQFDQAEKAALASIEISANTKLTNEYLADILAAFQGKNLPYSATDFQDAANNPGNPSIPGTKPGRGGVSGPAVRDVVAQGNAQSSDDMRENNRLLAEQNSLIRDLVSKLGGTVPPRGRTGLANAPVFMR